MWMLQVLVSCSPPCSFAISDQPRISATKSKAIMPDVPDVAYMENPPSWIISCLERLGCIYITDTADLSFQYISFLTVLRSLLVGDPENFSLTIAGISFYLCSSPLTGIKANPLTDWASSGTWQVLQTFSRARHNSSNTYLFIALILKAESHRY